MFEKLGEVVTVFQDIEKRLSDPSVIQNQPLFQRLGKDHRNLQPIVEAYQSYAKLQSQYQDNEEMIRTETGELKDLALEENKGLVDEIAELEAQLRVLLLPKDPNDDKNILLEIRSGAGGDEAGIFASDLYRMYTKFSEIRGWKVELMSSSLNSVGGFKEVILMVRGENVYSILKYESGVHRVQRVPQTETQGRVHTSTVTVAVLPEAEDVEIDIDPNELRIDVYRSSGPGGQSVNTTDSAVRITHEPTGLVVVCQDEKSQHKNKAKALKILKTRLLDLKQREQQEKVAADRRSQVGTGDRSEKIRTYNFPQGRITDHRIGETLYRLEAYMEGDLDEMVSKTCAYYEAESLKAHSLESTLSELTSRVGADS